MAKKRRYRVSQKLRSRYTSLQVNKKLRKAGIGASPLSVSQVSAKRFYEAITAGKKANKNGWMVDVHDLDDYRKMKCFLTSDGHSGVAVKRNGDVVSLFSSGGGQRMAKLLPYAVANGGRKLDCYGGGLQNMYAKWGARATGQTPWNDEYAPTDWDASKDGRYPVVAMILPQSLDDMIDAYDPKAVINMRKVRNFRSYGYMIGDRNRKLAHLRGNTSARVMTVG